jgi:hypothetical protein
MSERRQVQRPVAEPPDVRAAYEAEMREVMHARAGELFSSLRSYGSATTERREHTLLGLVRDLDRLVDREVVDSITSWFRPTKSQNLLLDLAVGKALRTPLATRNGLVHDWVSEYSVVALEGKGVLAGYSVSGEGRGLKFAIAKALFVMTLDDPRHARPGQLFDPRNLEYLEGLGLTLGADLFVGGVGPIQVDGMNLYVAAGGCHPEPENDSYVRGLIGGAIPTKDTFAGAVDHMFAEVVAGYLSDITKQIEPHRELEVLGYVRLLH